MSVQEIIFDQEINLIHASVFKNNDRKQ